MGVHGDYLYNEHCYKLVDRSAVPFRLTPNITEFMTRYYEIGSFQFSLGAFALAFQENEEEIRTQLQMLEQINSFLLMRNEEVPSSVFSMLVRENSDWLSQRGVALAPNVSNPNVKSKEKVDKAIIDAVSVSKDPRFLVQMNPSFCAWFYSVCHKHQS